MRRLSAAAVRRPRRRLGRRLGWWFGVQRLAGGRPHRPSAVRQLGAATRCDGSGDGSGEGSGGGSLRRVGVDAQAVARCGGSGDGSGSGSDGGSGSGDSQAGDRIEPPPPARRTTTTLLCRTSSRLLRVAGDDGGGWRRRLEAGECGGGGMWRQREMQVGAW